MTQTVLEVPLLGNPIKSGPGRPGGRHGFTERKKHISLKKKTCSETSCSPKAGLRSATPHAPPAATLNQRGKSGLSLDRPTYVSIREPPAARLGAAPGADPRPCLTPNPRSLAWAQTRLHLSNLTQLRSTKLATCQPH